MSRSLRVVVSMTTLAAMAVLAMIILPGGAAGEVKAPRAAESGDRFVFGRDAVIDNAVSGSVQVYGGAVDVREVIDGDLLVMGGDLTIRDHGRVAGNVILAGGRVTGGEDRIGGRVYSLATPEGAAVTMQQRAITLSLLFVWLVVAVVVTLINGREVRASSIETRASALYCFVLGLVAVTSLVLTAIVFSYLVSYLIGIPLLLALAVFAIVTKVYGMIAVFHAVGTLVAGSRNRRQLESRRWLRGDLAMVVIGLLILGAIRMIPVVGGIIWALASILGFGVALATRFGRREPWFLTWRVAEA
jgi:hypothetical protein